MNPTEITANVAKLAETRTVVLPGLERGREPPRSPAAPGPGWIERLRERIEKALSRREEARAGA